MLWGIDLTGNSVTLGGTRTGILRCWLHGFNGARYGKQLTINGKSNILGFNQFSDSTAGLWVRPGGSMPNIFRNYFLRINDALGGATNGYEAIQVLQGVTNRKDYVRALIEYNLFSFCNTKTGNSENETISIKSAGNIVRFNTLINGARTITNRFGLDNVYTANYINGSGRQGMHIYDGGAGNTSGLLGNVVVGGRGIRVYAGNCTGDNPSPPPIHPRCDTYVIVGNRATILLGDSDSTDPNPQAFPATNLKLGANPGSTVTRKAVGTVTSVSENSYVIPAAAQLAPSQVGPGATWTGWPVR